MSQYVCPFCFNKADSDDVRFQCSNPGCTMRDRVRAEFEKNAPLLPGENIERFPTVFKARPTGLFSRLFGAHGPREAKCPQCDSRTSIRACPICHSPFPHGVDELSNMVIAIIGAKETGKSHYIAVLIHRIYELYDQFGWTLMAFDDETMKRYDEQFRKKLYVEKTVIPITQKARGNTDVRKPLLYSLSLSRGRSLKSITLAFFDTAGEDMNDETEMRRYTPYIYNAAGIILLLDPLQQRGLREQLAREKIESLPDNIKTDANTSVGNIINKTVNLIVTKRQLSRSKRIGIPLAVAFSKMDEFRDVLGKEAPIFQPTRHKGYFDKAEFGEIDGFVRNWVGHFDRQFIQGTQYFSDSAFFGVSALGARPDQNDHLAFEPRPERVEDPFLWLLWKNHFISGR